MKKKILASFLLGILLVFNVFAPIVNALDNLSTTTTTESVSESSVITSPELSIDVLDEKTNQFATGIQLTLIDSETKEAVETWQSSESDRKLSLIPERIYTLQVATDGTSYETIVDKDLKLAKDGHFYQKSESGDWQLVEGGLRVQLQSNATEEKTTESETTETTQIEAKEIKLPKVIAVFDKTKNIPTTFEIVSEDGLTKLVEWSSEKDTPKVTLDTVKIYLIRVVSTESGYASTDVLEIRLNKDGDLEYLIEGDWKTLDATPTISLKKVGYVSFRAGQSTPLSTPQTVGANEIAPINKLRIVDNIPGASVTYQGGTNVRDQFAITNGTVQPNGGSPLYGGGSLANNYIGRYLDHNIYKTERNAHTVQFNGSNTNHWNYTTDVKAGWNQDDLNLATTSMTAKFRYTNAAYYEGRLVDAVATIKVTPQKNRTGQWGDYNRNADYDRLPYYPSIQVGATLFSGWAWQNVNEFQIDIQFYEKGSSTPINFTSGEYSDMDATYYTINSLNPQGQYNNGTDSWHGPEYVLPANGTVERAYKYSRSNITTRYTGDPLNQNQYAYNGGTATWGGDQDYQTSPDWSMNSMLFTTSNTSHITLTLGNLSRPSKDGGNGGQNGKRTNYMWATISTDAFTNTYVNYKKIGVRKDWQGLSNPTNNIDIELWATWKQNGSANRQLIQTQTLGTYNNWQADFNEVPDEASMQKIIEKQHKGMTITDFKYETVEKNIPDGYKVKYDGGSTERNGFVITNYKNTDISITKKWYRNGQPMVHDATRGLPNIKVILKRKVGNTVDKDFNQEVQLNFHRDQRVAWKATVSDLPVINDQGREYTYYIVEDPAINPDLAPNYIFLKEYLNQGITLKPNPADNQLGVSNDRFTTDLKIEKQWFKQDGKTPLQNENLPETLKVRIYQTTNGSTTNGTLFRTTTLTRSEIDGKYVWETTEKELPLRSTDGKTYYSYYIEEDKPQGYLEISDKNQKQLINRSSSPFTQTNATMTLKNKVNPVYPSTGGFGNLPYISIGLLSLFMASIIYIMQKKKGI
ncbi:TPA: Cna B-type domain-containing protein [Streptococcus suis 8830]|uniref:Cna B-type domain-containing protein n=1 Tax=Streptococcus suis TaxID=1307 RepID=UPI000411407D|nr:Cna B-type domain-containing protein [Streptococcus suis]HEM3203993.1 Cna B-type domain-containing protein [Streptococcus suis 8830]